MFEKYFKEQILSNIPPRSIIVLDNAFYHSRKIEKVPNTCWRKDEIREWLQERNIHYEDYMLKKDLLGIVLSDLYRTDTFLSLIIPLEIYSMTQFSTN